MELNKSLEQKIDQLAAKNYLSIINDIYDAELNVGIKNNNIVLIEQETEVSDFQNGNFIKLEDFLNIARDSIVAYLKKHFNDKQKDK